MGEPLLSDSYVVVEALPGNGSTMWVKRDDPRLTTWLCGHARRVDAYRGWWNFCPGCERMHRYSRRYVLAHVLLLVLQVVLGCVWVADRLSGCR